MCGIMVVGFLPVEFAAADEATEGVLVKSQQMVVETKGMVCSFCAYGAEKSLRKLSFLDRTQLDKNGVLVDIKTGHITLALKPDEPFDLKEIHKRIKKAGYEAGTVHLRLKGVVEERDGLYFLHDPNRGQAFELIGDLPPEATQGNTVDIVGHVDLEQLVSEKEEKVYRVMLGKIERTS